MDVSFRIEVETLDGALDQLDYFTVLKLGLEATPAEIRVAYHRESRVYHPDRYAAVEDPVFRGQVGPIYRRINEAYTVLRDDARRKTYAAHVAGPDRAPDDGPGAPIATTSGEHWYGPECGHGPAGEEFLN